MSLIPSKNLVNRAFAWSKGNKGKGPIVIRFPVAWANRIGLVFEWYRLQDHKKFLSIQHRKELTSPFHHQFVLVELIGGSFCRFERTGDPDSRTHALSTVGSTAHDLVETFSSEELALGQEDSEVISRITFPNELDLLDILAICYALHQGEKTRHYTLQRFNCYFFAWSIITVLTRRVAHWGNTLSEELWGTVLTNSFNRVSQLSDRPLSDDGKNILAIRIFSLLDPDNPHYLQFLTDALRAELEVKTSRDRVNKALGNVLWRFTWDSTMLHEALKDLVKAATVSASRQSALGPSTARNAMRTVKSRRANNTVRLYLRERTVSIVRNIEDIMSRKCDDKQALQHKFSLSSAVHSVRHCYGTVLVAARSIMTDNLLHSALPHEALLNSRFQSFMHSVQHRAEFVRIMSRWGWVVMDLLEKDLVGVFDAGDNVKDDAVKRALDQMEMLGWDDPDHVTFLLREASLTNKQKRNYWGIFADWQGLLGRWVWALVHATLGQVIWQVMTQQERHSLLVYHPEPANPVGDPQMTGTKMAVSEFQDHIRAAIHDHAQMIGALRLGSEINVRQDIEAAISQVWERMPSAHIGGC
ncbi:hypothetical protein BDV93DRAFT_565241 [Ceratobasidium sp. AG-I]|nr:hypothetical protein BDV93DRAFT_565241 [Ceratobasidium sp. AG-I]